MSYEIIRSICIDEKQNKVFITCASNNCRPLYFDKVEFNSLSEMLKEKGREAVELRILKLYEEGSFQQGKNKYSKALSVLRNVFQEEYKFFDWNNHNSKYGSPEREEESNRRESKEFKDLLSKCLNYKLPKNKFLITKKNYDNLLYGKKCKTCIKWVYDKSKATKFNFKNEVEAYLSCFSGLIDVNILEVKQ